MSTVRIYQLTCTKAFVASMELGTRFSLEPWGTNTAQYEGYDDGGAVYVLPEGYTLGKIVTGAPTIFTPGGEACALVTHSSGRPQLVSSRRERPVLFPGGRWVDGTLWREGPEIGFAAMDGSLPSGSTAPPPTDSFALSTSAASLEISPADVIERLARALIEEIDKAGPKDLKQAQVLLQAHMNDFAIRAAQRRLYRAFAEILGEEAQS